MARYKASVETARPLEEVFAYVSDFSNTQEWDPGVAEAQRLDDGEVADGSEFRLVAVFMRRSNTLVYRVTEYEAPRLITLRAESPTIVSLDRITFELQGDGTRLTYDAALDLKGAMRIADPLLGLAFKRIGDRALAGMRKTLRTEQPVS